VNSTLLRTNNPQINDACDNLYIGEVLATCKTVQVPPVPASGIPYSSAATTRIAIATSSVVQVTSTVTADYAAATETDTEIDTSGDPNDTTLPFCDEL
jgi:hypothetical protein